MHARPYSMLHGTTSLTFRCNLGVCNGAGRQGCSWQSKFQAALGPFCVVAVEGCHRLHALHPAQVSCLCITPPCSPPSQHESRARLPTWVT